MARNKFYFTYLSTYLTQDKNWDMSLPAEKPANTVMGKAQRIC